ncbi:MAG: hypothetical protein J0M16_01875 [Gammaproteobacteria bacterium]|jgi:hypothetical protein|nr:hypothetical protein [Gammaproteobacteria bacterium]
MKKALIAGAVLALAGTAANATVITYNYLGGYHNGPWVTAGSNGAALDVVYGDGNNYGISAQNKCQDNNIITPFQTCASLGFVDGNNGTYQTTVPGAPNPKANYTGSLSYDDSLTFSYTDIATNQTETWFVVTGGTLAWTGSYGLEVLVAPSASSGKIGGSFFQYSFANGNVNLTTGARTSTSKCDLGIAGNAIVGALLCGFANPASSYQYSSSGAYVKPVNWTGVRDLGDGRIELLLSGNRFTATGSGNNLQERIILTPTTVPVPAAVWLFGSAVGLLGIARRKAAA